MEGDCFAALPVLLRLQSENEVYSPLRSEVDQAIKDIKAGQLSSR